MVWAPGLNIPDRSKLKHPPGHLTLLPHRNDGGKEGGREGGRKEFEDLSLPPTEQQVQAGAGGGMDIRGVTLKQRIYTNIKRSTCSLTLTVQRLYFQRDIYCSSQLSQCFFVKNLSRNFEALPGGERGGGRVSRPCSLFLQIFACVPLFPNLLSNLFPAF